MKEHVFVTMTGPLENPPQIDVDEEDILSILNETPTEPAFLPPVSPWAVVKGQALATLRAAVKDVEDALAVHGAANNKSVTLPRLKAALVGALREVEITERELDLERRRQRSTEK